MKPFDLDAINNAGLGDDLDHHSELVVSKEDDHIPTIDGLNRDQCISLWKSLERPVCIETSFILNTFLTQADQNEVNASMILFGFMLKKMSESKDIKSPEIMASLGIYLSMMLRYNPNMTFYIEGEHFLVRALNAYYPYITMYVTYFLIPAVHHGIDLDDPCSDTEHVSPVRRRVNLDQITRMNPANARVFEAKNVNPQDRRSNSPELKDESLAICPCVSVINRIMDMCPLNSPERRLFSELRRLKGSTSSHIISRLGLKTQKQELAILADDASLLEDPLSEDDIQKAIFMHSNRILSHENDFMFLPHHFDRAVQCLNLEMTKLTFHLSDWVSDKTLDELFFMSKELKHAQCLEILKLVVQKNISLCGHKIKKLPESWREPILGIYTTPRWKISLDHHPVPNINNSLGATLEYYRVNLCSSEKKDSFVNTLEKLSDKLSSEELRESFIANLRSMNMSYYILCVSGYSDFLSDDDHKTTFANTQDSLLNDVFELSRSFVFPCRERDKIFLLDYNNAEGIVTKGENYYNRNTIDPVVLDGIRKTCQMYNRQGLSSKCVPMKEFIQELVHGRELDEICTCRTNKNFIKKLSRLLRQYNVKEESFEVIDLADILFKFSLISINLKADSISLLCSKIYQMIKLAGGENKEALKRTAASLILIYSRVAGGEYVIAI